MCPLGADQYVIYILDLSTWWNFYTMKYIMYIHRVDIELVSNTCLCHDKQPNQHAPGKNMKDMSILQLVFLVCIKIMCRTCVYASNK